MSGCLVLTTHGAPAIFSGEVLRLLKGTSDALGLLSPFESESIGEAIVVVRIFAVLAQKIADTRRYGHDWQFDAS